jgi:two-component system, NtrC family, sensor kinase
LDLLLKSSLEKGTSESVRPRILIVDDREQNRYVVCRALEAAGFECAQASTGFQALEVARTEPDLIILDVRLPDISGYEVCQRIKKDPRTAAVSVLQISASFTSTEDRVRALDGGADAYLTHPVDRLVLVATVRSLLRLRNAEMVARKSAEHWQSTFDALAEGLAMVDANNRLVRWNDAFSQICGSKIELNVGDDAARICRLLVGTDSMFHLNSHKRQSSEFVIDRRTVQFSVSRIRGDEASGEKILILTDVTDRRLAEYALRTAEKLAATGKLANAIAHEINNPLEALTNLIYLAGRTESIDSVRDLLSRADAELARIARITRQSLSFHRDTQVPVSVDVGELVDDIVGLFERTAGVHGVRLLCERRPVPTLQAFPGQLGQIFGNLVRNASEAAAPGTAVVVRVRAIPRDGVEGVRVCIHDCGRGIPLDVQAKMFDPFFTTKALKGSGLGLWVSRTLVLKHGGTIRFRSSERPGHSGTTFEVFLPVGGLKLEQDAPEVEVETVEGR